MKQINQCFYCGRFKKWKDLIVIYDEEGELADQICKACKKETDKFNPFDCVYEY